MAVGCTHSGLTKDIFTWNPYKVLESHPNWHYKKGWSQLLIWMEQCVKPSLLANHRPHAFGHGSSDVLWERIELVKEKLLSLSVLCLIVSLHKLFFVFFFWVWILAVWQSSTELWHNVHIIRSIPIELRKKGKKLKLKECYYMI